MKKDRSSFETYSDKLLFLFLKKVYEKGFEEPSLMNDNFIESLDEIGNLMGDKDKLDYIDLDYLTTVYISNLDKFIQPKLTEPLIRPEVGKYAVETTVDMTERKTVVYSNTVISYNPHVARDQLRLQYNTGDFYYDEGEVVWTDYNDTDVHDVQWGDSRKIK